MLEILKKAPFLDLPNRGDTQAGSGAFLSQEMDTKPYGTGTGTSITIE